MSKKLNLKFHKSKKNLLKITGAFSEGAKDLDKVWDFLKAAQEVVHTKQLLRKEQKIILPHEPVLVAFMSDLHIGSGGTDYKQIIEDTKLITETEGAYAGIHGDITDNWLVGRLVALQRGQAVSKDLEDKIFINWLETIGPKLLWWCQGNHDNWTEKLSNWAPAREALKGTQVLYDREQIMFDLVHGKTTRKVVVRHKWRYSSIFNPTHGIEVGWDRLGLNFDIGVAGHTHIGTFCRSFFRHDKRRYAVLTGTYKTYDAYGEEEGFQAPQSSGCGCFVFSQTGEINWFDDLKQGIGYLNYLRYNKSKLSTPKPKIKISKKDGPIRIKNPGARDISKTRQVSNVRRANGSGITGGKSRKKGASGAPHKKVVSAPSSVSSGSNKHQSVNNSGKNKR